MTRESPSQPPRPAADATRASTEPAPSPVARGLKIVLGASAVLSLVFAIRQATIYVTDYRDRQRRVAERLATAKLQRSAHDYRAAWSSLRDAATVDPRSDTVQIAREALAMNWLENAAASQGLSLGALGDTVSTVLTRGAAGATGARRGDLLAHLGWADFLRSRDGQVQLDPAARYREALAADSQNVYAHAMLAHWLLWKGPRQPDEARAHFAAALRSGREGAYVRRLQFAAYANQQSEAGDVDLLRVANAMRAANDTVTDPDRRRVWDLYTHYVARSSGPPAEALAPLAGLAPRDLLETYRWLFANAGYAESDRVTYAYQLARLQEAVGDSAAALTSYRVARTAMTRGDDRYLGRIDSALARLAR
jgi:hypothetical protein